MCDNFFEMDVESGVYSKIFFDILFRIYFLWTRIVGVREWSPREILCNTIYDQKNVLALEIFESVFISQNSWHLLI